jgi:hypothetical protein
MDSPQSGDFRVTWRSSVKIGDLVRDAASRHLGIVVALHGRSARVKLNHENVSRWVFVQYLKVINENR